MSSTIQILDLVQGSDDWHKERLKHIGASEVSSILGIGFDTPHQIWLQKLGLAPPKEETAAMRRGKQLEPVARNEFIKQSHWEVWPCVVINSHHPIMLASMDGIRTVKSRFGEHITHGVEIKVPSKEDSESHQMAMDGIIPPIYIPQLIHQMIVCELQEIFYFSWNENSNKIITFSLENKAAQELIKKEKEFWDMVQNLKEPDLTQRDYVKKNDDEWNQVSSDWREAKKERQAYEEREETFRNRLIELSEGKNCQGNDVRLTKYVKKGNIDTKKIVKDYNIDEEKYRKDPTTTWRLS